MKDFLRWVSQKPCMICGNGTYHDDLGETLVDPHHVRTRGAGGSDMDNVVPLCRRHHQLVHQIGMPAFEDRYEVRLNSKAREFGRAWRTRRAREREE